MVMPISGVTARARIVRQCLAAQPLCVNIYCDGRHATPGSMSIVAWPLSSRFRVGGSSRLAAGTWAGLIVVHYIWRGCKPLRLSRRFSLLPSAAGDLFFISTSHSFGWQVVGTVYGYSPPSAAGIVDIYGHYLYALLIAANILGDLWHGQQTVVIGAWPRQAMPRQGCMDCW